MAPEILNELLVSFDHQSESVSQLLNKFANLLQTECPPHPSWLDELTQEFTSLLVCYTKISEQYQNFTGKAAPEDTTARELIRLCMVQEQAQARRQDILRFISLTSPEEKFSAALMPIQLQARDALEKQEQFGDSSEIERWIKVSSSFLAILDSVQQGNFPDDEAMEQLENILPEMTLTVQRGILRGKYVLMNESSASPVLIPVDQQEPSPSAVLEKTPVSAVELGPIPTVAPEVEPLFPLKKAEPNAKTFMKLWKLVPKSAASVLPFLSNFGFLTAEQLFELTQIAECRVSFQDFPELERELEFMRLKNLIAAYPAGADREVAAFCLTPYAAGSMRKETVTKRNLFSFSLSKEPLIAKGTFSLETITFWLRNNDLLISYLGRIKETAPESYACVQKSIHMGTSRYSVLLPIGGDFVTVSLCRPEELSGCTGDLLCLDQSARPDDGQNAYCYTNQPWHWTDGAWRTLHLSPTDESDQSASKDVGAGLEKEETPAAETVKDIVPEQVLPDESLISKQPIENVSVAPAEIARSLLEKYERAGQPSDEEIQMLIFSLLNSGVRRYEDDLVQDELAQAVVLARCASTAQDVYPGCTKLSEQLLFATATPLMRLDYSGENLTALFDSIDPQTEPLMLAAYLRAMFAPSQAYDYTLQGQVKSLFEDYEKRFPSFPDVKLLFHELNKIFDVSPCGFTTAVLSYLGSVDKRELQLKALSDRANALHIFNKNAVPRINGMINMIDLCFGPKSDFYTCLEIIAADDRTNREYVGVHLGVFCTNAASYEIAKENVEVFIDTLWSKARKPYDANSGRGMELQHIARQKIRDGIMQRLDLMVEWLAMTEESVEWNSTRLRAVRESLQRLIPQISGKLVCQKSNSSMLVCAMLEHLEGRLSGDAAPLMRFTDLLRTGVFSLDDNGLPVLDGSLNRVRYFEPWRNMLQHIATPVCGLREARREIDLCGSPVYDNLRQARHIAAFLGEPADVGSVKSAQDGAEQASEDFQEKLELSYTFSRLELDEHENLIGQIIDYQQKFFELQDFGVWRAFLSALEQQLSEYSEQHSQRIQRDLVSRRTKLAGECCPLLDRAEELLDTENLAAAEEYLNRLDAGERELPDTFRSSQQTTNHFLTFLSPEIFEPIFNYCSNFRGDTLPKIGPNYLDQHPPKDWTSRQFDNAKSFLATWPVRKRTASTASTTVELFRRLGFTVEKSTANPPKGRAELYELTVKPDRSNKADYRHPIAKFGTGLNSPLRVVCLFGNFTPKELVDTVCSLELRDMSVVLVDAAIDRAARCKIAEIIHKEKVQGQASFLVIDRVLMLYLAMLQETERLSAMLQCTLPYTIYQPFTTGDSDTVISDEMFCGRVAELSSITNENGPCIMYGGRQLGKSALLQRSASLSNVPAERRYALTVTVVNCGSEAAFSQEVSQKIRSILKLPIKPTNTVNALCDELHKLFQSKRIVKLLLLLDEADKFLSAIAPEYLPLKPLIDLRKETRNSFKFVLAGLHNVFRAKRVPNSVLDQLGDPLCIKPLSPIDALDLISRPLEYLGFQIKPDLHMEAVLANTNYYPGIIQFFGYKLVESLSTQYSKYYEAAKQHPPFPLNSKQLGSIISSGDLNEGIRKRIRWTLELDPRYYMLARCIAWLYYYHEGERSGSSLGFTVEEIQEVAAIAFCQPLPSLKDASRAEYVALLEELVAMGILSCLEAHNTYRLRRHTFLHVIGKDLETLEKEVEQLFAESGE